MSAPGTYHFIGPLTEVQQRRRTRARYRFIGISETMYVHGVSFVRALAIIKQRSDRQFSTAWRVAM